MSNISKRILSAIIALFVLLGTFIYLYHRNSVKSQQIAVYEQNWKASQDSIKYYKLKNGELLAEQQSYILSESAMKTQLNMSDIEIKDLKKQLNSALAQVAKVTGTITIDSIYIESQPDIVTIDTLSAPFDYSDDWLKLSGRFDYDNNKATTSIHNITMSTPLTIGTTEDNKFFVSTPNPYLTITEITSVISDKSVKKRSHWGFGVGVGFGLQYGLHYKQIDYGPQVSVGLHYNF